MHFQYSTRKIRVLEQKFRYGSRFINIERNNLLKSTEITPLSLATAETVGVIDLWLVFHAWLQLQSVIFFKMLLAANLLGTKSLERFFVYKKRICNSICFILKAKFRRFPKMPFMLIYVILKSEQA